VGGDSLKQEYEPLSERKFIFPGLNQYFRHQSERALSSAVFARLQGTDRGLAASRFDGCGDSGGCKEGGTV
jgi:hypothetical protein